MNFEETTTEWVINTYANNKTNKEINLEPAKNFVFIWNLFENMSKGEEVFLSQFLKFDEFQEWTNCLIFENNMGKITLKNPRNGKEISKRLIDKIDKSFNHFFQKYDSDKNEFISVLYNQDTPQVNKEKEKFISFADGMNKQIIQDKIMFLFFVTKRMRNKFFHGIKSKDQVSKDHKEFENCNQYLISIIELIGDYS